eukprot:CAMPEP_0197052762 /NCGR_PEP_ID=MMETSP1384-20130603/27183_1 /TAXON_ID=29189 /ORGANISM="Ammonia sp." /LENGTH=63 /DNA_ID=CAMNT_0042485561 /DNA_START=33 /DNA_END=221 /DNA_ORIENTATION=-
MATNISLEQDVKELQQELDAAQATIREKEDKVETLERAKNNLQSFYVEAQRKVQEKEEEIKKT